MTIQEKIGEGVRKIAEDWFAPNGFASRTMPNERSFEGDMLQYLHSQGLVIMHQPLRGEDLTGCILARIEPLIEEGK